MGPRTRNPVLAQSRRVSAPARQTQIRNRRFVCLSPEGPVMCALTTTRKFASAAIFATMLPLSAASAQQATEIQISYSNGQFQPSEVRAPADKPVVFRIRNLDGKAMEFESTS